MADDMAAVEAARAASATMEPQESIREVEADVEADAEAETETPVSERRGASSGSPSAAPPLPPALAGLPRYRTEDGVRAIATDGTSPSSD